LTVARASIELPLATIAVCEVDEGMLNLISDRLTAERFEVLPSRTAPDALRLCHYSAPDILVLDLALPAEKARELVRLVRASDPRLPIIVLVPQGRVDLRELGADESLAKPFRHEALRSRIDAVLRHRHRRFDQPVRVGEILIDPGRRKVTVGGRRVELSRLEFALLRMMATDPTRVFAKEELLRGVWGPRARRATTRTLDSHASRLRRKLDPEDRRFIVNFHGVGYSLMPDEADTDPVVHERGTQFRLEFAGRLTILMSESGLSVDGLAERAKLDLATLKAIFEGKHPVWIDEVFLLAGALGVTPAELVGGPSVERPDGSEAATRDVRAPRDLGSRRVKPGGKEARAVSPPTEEVFEPEAIEPASVVTAKGRSKVPADRKQRVADSFGGNLKQVRRRKGISQFHLAKRVGLHSTEISKLECGLRVPRIDTLIGIADGLGVEPAELLDGTVQAWRGLPLFDGQGDEADDSRS
jgi:DNA-binding response OmpR family regulator/transcriptional regulator with XRE-family HTH domain